MLLTNGEKDWAYQIGYWVTAFLPVLLGFGLTMLLIWYFTKTYKGKDDDFDSEFDEDDN
jgi:hypothetical protein